jgi:histidinol-phosphate aminotransferase
LSAHKPCVMAISNPNGPTGAWLDAEDISTLHVACAQRGHVLVLDECYRGFDGNETDVGPDIDDHLVRIRSFSKAYGLAGSRVASIVASPGVVDYLARYCPEFAVSGPTLAMLGPALDRAASFCALRRDVMASRDWLVARVEEIKPEWEPLPTRANFINFRTSGSSEARDIAGRLLQAGIRVKTTDGLPGLDGCVRFTLTERSLLAPLVQGLAAAAEGAHA